MSVESYTKKQQEMISHISKTNPELILDFTFNTILTTAFNRSIYDLTGLCVFSVFTNVYFTWKDHCDKICNNLFGTLHSERMKHNLDVLVQGKILDVLIDNGATMLATKEGMHKFNECMNLDKNTISSNIINDSLENLPFWMTVSVIKNSYNEDIDSYELVQFNAVDVLTISQRLTLEIKNLGKVVLELERK